MPTKRSSASLRYLKARLQVLKRPTVWGSAFVLLLPLFFLADYWKQPEKYTAGINQSPEIGRSIPAPASGNIPLPPLNDGSRISIPSTSDLDAQSSSGSIDSLTALLTSPLPDSEQENSSEPKSTVRNGRNSLSSRSSNLPKIDLSDAFNSSATPTTAQTLPVPNGSETNSSPANGAPASSQIQAALDRIAGQPTAGNQEATQGNGQMGSQAGATAQAAPNSYGQFGSSLNVPPASQSFSQPSSFQPYTPQTSPSPGTTGYTLPPAFRTTTNSSSPNFGPSQSSSGFRSVPQTGSTIPTQPTNRSSLGSYGNTPGYSSQIPSYPSPTYTSPQSQVESAPFSVPRTPPGRYIGGGEINTFSNP